MLQFSHGAVQWLTSQVLNTTIAVTGLGFTPKAIRFYWVGLQSNSPTAANSAAVSERRGIGFAQSTTSRACVGTTSLDNSGNADCGTIWSNTACVITVTAAGVVDGLLDISSIDADGFTLIVDDVAPANITVFWEAWGGPDISYVTIGAIAEPAATGNQSYTATGFVASPSTSDQCIMFAGTQGTQVSGTGVGTDSGLHAGFATSTLAANNITLCGNSDDNAATMVTEGYNYTGDCLSMITIAGANANARATLTAFAADQFTLNWTARNTTNRRSIYMAIKGGVWEAGSVTINGNTLNSTANISDKPFTVRGISLLGAMKVISTAATSTANDRMAFGSGISTTSRNSAGVLDQDALATSNIATSVNYTQVLVHPTTAGALATAYDISGSVVNGITLVTDTAGGVASEWIGYLIFGDRRPRTVSIGHPFIN